MLSQNDTLVKSYFEIISFLYFRSLFAKSQAQSRLALVGSTRSSNSLNFSATSSKRERLKSSNLKSFRPSRHSINKGNWSAALIFRLTVSTLGSGGFASFKK